MTKRGTRVQAVIFQNGRYILLRHHFLTRELYFWGIPGGAVEPGESEEQAVMREAEEETGLKIRLLPFRFENDQSDETYDRFITFVAVPGEGKARVGVEPEEVTTGCVCLEDLRWQELFDDNELDEVGLRVIAPVRQLWLSGCLSEADQV